jgi:hypothetical protein
MPEILRALGSIVTNGMPEGGKPQQPSRVHEILRGGAVEEPTRQQPDLLHQVNQGAPEPHAQPGPFSQGFENMAHRAKAEVGTRLGGAATSTFLGGAVEHPKQIDVAAARRKALQDAQRQQAAKSAIETVAGIAAKGTKGFFGLLFKAAVDVSKAVTKKSSTPQYQKSAKTSASSSNELMIVDDNTVDGEFHEL